MTVEKFKSHQQLQKRCVELIKNKQIVCQSIIDMSESDLYHLSLFNLEKNYIYQETDVTNDDYGMWKVGREYSYNDRLN